MYYQDIRLNRPFKFHMGTIQYHNQPRELHVHDCLEINIVVENEIENRFGNRTYIGKPGDVFICRPFEPHWGKSNRPSHAKWILVLFSPSLARMIPGGFELLIPFYTHMLSTPLIPASNPHAEAIRDAALDALHTDGLPDNLIDAKAFARLIEILLHVSQYSGQQHKLRSNQTEFEGILTVIHLLLSHYKEDLSADSLVEASNLGKSRFFKTFRSVTGTSPNDFLFKLRIQDALDLIVRNPDLSVTDICMESGFQSLRTFNKRFKEYTGISPREYRSRISRL